MPAQAFIDDSGGKGQSRTFFLAGLVSNSERWATFSDEWRACMRDAPSINCFHMKEAAHLSGEFTNWKTDARDAKLRDLARVINRHAEFVIYCGIDLDAHAKIWARHPQKLMRDFYFWPFHIVTMGACLDLWEVCGWRERFEIIFDEQVIFGPRARAWYPVVREVVRIKEPEASVIMPVDVMFQSDSDFLPLQAADMWAWCIRRNSDRPEEHAFEWLLAEFPSVSEARYCNYYDFDRMSSVHEEANRLFQAGEIPEELDRVYRELFGAPSTRSRNNLRKRPLE